MRPGRPVPEEDLEELRQLLDPSLPTTDQEDGREVDEAEEVGSEEIHETDLGNARRLVRRHGRDIRYVRMRRTWLIWDGRRWAPDVTGRILALAKDTVKAILREEAADESRPTERRERLAKWSIRCEDRRKLDDMVTVAETEPEVAALAGDFDQDPWLLCVRNGVLDLRTGERRPHDRGLMISMLADVDYDPEARSDLWESFLGAALPDEETRAFLQRAAGYSLTGKTTEEVLLFLHGPKLGGKTTFVEAFRRTLGDYAAAADFTTFLRGRPLSGDQPRADLVRLYGKRLVNSVEVDEGRRLAEGLVKHLTGGDTVVARGLYQRDPVEAAPVFKLWLAANHRPRVSDDAALWRRILLVPFDRSIPDPDPAVKEELVGRDHRPAILAWAVQGCLDWQRRGLDPPATVRHATDAWEAESDPLYGFTDDAGPATLDPQGWAATEALWKAYQEWAGKGAAVTSQDALGRRLRTLPDVRPDKRRGKRGWRGVRLDGGGIQEPST